MFPLCNFHYEIFTKTNLSPLTLNQAKGVQSTSNLGLTNTNSKGDFSLKVGAIKNVEQPNQIKIAISFA